MINLSYDKTVTTVIPSQRGLEIVVAAWELFKAHGWDQRANREVVSDAIFSEGCMGEPDGREAVLPQKVVPSLYEVCAWNAYASSTAEWHDENPFKLEITPEIKAKAEVLRDTVVSHHVLKILSDQSNDFQKRINEIIGKQAIKVSELKTLAYIVPMAGNITREQLMDERLSAASGSHISAPGSKITTVVTVLGVRYSKEFSVWNHTAITDDGHAVTFFNKREFKDGTRMRIAANVKDHRTMYKRPNVAETRLNYVKVLDCPLQ